MRSVRIGAICWNQYTDWKGLFDAGVRADQLGYDTLWTWDHLYPIVGNPRGPMLEGWLAITAWAVATRRARIGLLVGANPYREPTLVAKMATTLDHISAGRAILGIGAAWFEDEARDFGLPFGTGVPERLRWLGEALPIMRGMLDGIEPTASGPRYRATHPMNLPKPIQSHLPILIGGGGEAVTLKLVAQYADMNNIPEDNIEALRRKEDVLLSHCGRVGRDPAEIERTMTFGPVFIRDSLKEATKVGLAAWKANGSAEPERTTYGTPEQVAAKLAPFVELGYQHLIAHFPAPYDDETMTRFATEVRPLLEQL
jgi:alkanesulfonate monooxygenase SsuD/methylene tetrahydromethanopterin reductase-like flavin-dependent oxidoreductase (luciferase family)